VRLINALFSQAVREGASDIHVEAFEGRSVVRFRRDGMLRDVIEPPQVVHGVIVSRIKIMARLDIAEKRQPQDGRIALRLAGRSVDVRVSILPTAHGERVVLRLLDKQAGRLDLTGLGMADTTLAALRELVRQPHGIILVTGPTGSGKTTTLYAALGQLDAKRTNIVTVEDPIEYDLDGVGQTQVNPRIELTFARALRAILRQDPDVVMIGEIRDLETAQIAVQASLTGHTRARDPAHQRRGGRRGTARGHGHRAVPGRLEPARRARRAAGAAAVPGVPPLAPARPCRAGLARERERRRGGHHLVHRERLRGVRVYGLSGRTGISSCCSSTTRPGA